MKKVLVLAVAALALAACGRGRSANPISNVREATKDRNLQSGAWQSDCKTDLKMVRHALATLFAQGNPDALKSYRIEYKFDGENVTRSEFHYRGADCTQDAVTFTERGTIHIETDPNKMTNDKAKNIDMKFTELWVDVKQPGLSVANAIGLCGKKDWEADKNTRVTGASAQENCYGIQVPRDVANIYKIDADKNPDELMLGADPDGPIAADKRPSSIGMSAQTFHKK